MEKKEFEKFVVASLSVTIMLNVLIFAWVLSTYTKVENIK